MAGAGAGQNPAPGSVGANTAPAPQGASGVAGEHLAGGCDILKSTSQLRLKSP